MRAERIVPKYGATYSDREQKPLLHREAGPEEGPGWKGRWEEAHMVSELEGHFWAQKREKAVPAIKGQTRNRDEMAAAEIKEIWTRAKPREKRLGDRINADNRGRTNQATQVKIIGRGSPASESKIVSELRVSPCILKANTDQCFFSLARS